MEISKDRIAAISKKLSVSKMRLLVDHAFFGVLLTSLKFSLSSELEQMSAYAATDGETIFFDPNAVEKFSEKELDFILMHEVMHIILKHTLRRPQKDDNDIYNWACDIVVNSNILHTLGIHGDFYVCGEEAVHLTPNQDEGYYHSVEEVYKLILKKGLIPCFNAPKNFLSNGGKAPNNNNSEKDKKRASGKVGKNDNTSFDYHGRWGSKSLNKKTKKLHEDLINKKILEAYEIAKDRKQCGGLPAYVERIIKELKQPQIDWRVYLNNFIQENIVDYSFAPPDKRFQDSIFLLPDFNELDEEIKNVLFFVDTSGSMSNEEITLCYSEIQGAINQFNGKLTGYLGFFDANVKSVVKFDESVDIKNIIPKGGGGTEPRCIFNYIKEHMEDDLPSSVIILTDGFINNWPSIDDTLGIPVLWVINNNESKPPFGKVARIDVG